jgi:hypothetical protein
MPLMTGRKFQWLVLALMVTACGSVEPTPSAVVVDSLEPSPPAPTAESTITAEPSPTYEPTASPALAADDVAQVVTTDLVMRSAPGGGEDSFVYPGALDAPTLLFVIDGPVTASNYDWYLVYPFVLASSERHEEWRLGWVAAGSRDGEAWIAPAALSCPLPDFEALEGLSFMARLACFGDSPLAVEGSFESCGSFTPGIVTPGWLGAAACSLRPVGTAPDAPYAGPRFVFHVPDDQPLAILGSAPGTKIRIDGHFDDPAAQACHAGPRPGPEPTPGPPGDEILAAQGVVLGCRTSFVVTEAALLGP